MAVILYCYWKGLRPQAFATANGVRIGLIRIGNPVTGVFPGVLLEATSRIATGIFAGSKILITAYDIHHGAVGFIINKQSFTENGEIINIGGPVSPHSCHVIHDNPNISGSQFITEGVYIGGSVNELNQNHQKSTIFGYSGWSALQLDGEIRAGVWRILQEVSPQDIFA